MESAQLKATKNSTKSPSFLLRFSKLCKLGSVGVLSGENPNPALDSLFAVKNADETDSGEQKIHPQPPEESMLEKPETSEQIMVSRLFDAISALKSAYIQFQQAHIPYEPKLIRVSDALVISELESLSELKDLYLEMQRRKSPVNFSLSSEIRQHQELLDELQYKLQSQESEILRLKWEIEGLDQRNAELEEEIQQKGSPDEDLFVLGRELTPSVFSDVFKLAYNSIHNFTKPLISLMKASCWDLDRAANSMGNSVIYAERSHKKYAFESYLSKSMLGGVCGECCFKLDHFDRVMGSGDPFDPLLEDPDSDFGKFCRSKYLAAVHSKMEASFFGNLDQRAFVLNGGHPRTPFYQAFVRMSRWVWALQVMAHSFIPKAEPFYVKAGQLYSDGCMESVVKLTNGEEDDRLTVGFTVMPGFKIGRYVIRCRVYLSRFNSSS